MDRIRTLQELADALYSQDEALKKEILRTLAAHRPLVGALKQSIGIATELSKRSQLPVEGFELLQSAQQVLNQIEAGAPVAEKPVSPTPIYLWQGVGKGGYPQSLAEDLGGNISVAEWVASFAPMVDEFIENDHRQYPGTFHYEISPVLGAWLVNNPQATKDDFRAELERVTDAWINAHRPVQARPAG